MKISIFNPFTNESLVLAVRFSYICTVNALQVSVLEFSRDRKMMSVLCSRKQSTTMFSKGAPESIISRCTSILCNDNGSIIALTANIRTELEAMFNRLDNFLTDDMPFLVIVPLSMFSCMYFFLVEMDRISGKVMFLPLFYSPISYLECKLS